MQMFESDGVSIAYRQDGPPDAAALLLINGLGTDLHMWDAQIDALSPHVRVIRSDCRGHGGSGPGDGQGGLDRLGRDLVALLDHLGVERAHVCGLSLGGALAQWLCIHHPERVRRAVFANTAARIGSVEGWQARIDAVRAGGMRAVREVVVERLFSPAFRTQHPAEVARFIAMLESCDPAGYMGACAALRDADLRAQAASIHAPALVVGASLDLATPPQQAEELSALVPGSQLLVLPEAGHLSNVERAPAFSAALLGFLLAES